MDTKLKDLLNECRSSGIIISFLIFIVDFILYFILNPYGVHALQYLLFGNFILYFLFISRIALGDLYIIPLNYKLENILFFDESIKEKTGIKTEIEYKIICKDYVNTIEITNTENTISPKTLIKNYVEFYNNNPKLLNLIKTQDIELDSFNYYQYLTIQSLCKAFKIEDIQSFSNGYFEIIDVDDKIKKEFWNYINNNKIELLIKNIETYNINYIFTSLLNFRVKLDTLYQIEGGGLVPQNINVISYHIKSNIKKKLQDDIKYIDNLLSLIISPEEKIFTIKELIDDYSYPNVNLDSLYADNM